MSYQSKLDEARALLVQHNSQIPANTAGAIKVDDFFQRLANAGGTNDAALSQCAWEDLEEFGLPRLLARQVAQIFRAKDKEEKPVLKRSKVEAMSVEDLIANYDPKIPGSLVTTRLTELLSGRRFVVFNDNGTINTKVTTKLAREILDDYPEREQILVDDVPYKTYKIGERPDQCFDENPLYPGRILRPDGDCDQTNRSWNDVSLEVRQILYLAGSKTGEVRINSLNDAHNLIDLVVGKSPADALKVVRLRFAKSAAMLKELAAQGRAPTLKVFKKTSEKPNNPFGPNVRF